MYGYRKRSFIVQKLPCGIYVSKKKKGFSVKGLYEKHLLFSFLIKDQGTWIEKISFFASYFVHCALNLSHCSFKIISFGENDVSSLVCSNCSKTVQIEKFQKMTSQPE